MTGERVTLYLILKLYFVRTIIFLTSVVIPDIHMYNLLCI